MKVFNELLGFAVLTGPLWLILVLLGLGVWIGVKAAKRFKSAGAKLAVGVVVVAAFLVLPFADEIAGRIYLNHLCATEAGVKVYQTVELPAEYWNENGEPKFFNQYGNLDHELWVKELDESGGHVIRQSSIFSIDRDNSLVKERASRKVLAEVTTFRYWGGWARRNFSLHNTANSCRFINEPGFSRAFYGQIFKPAISK